MSIHEVPARPLRLALGLAVLLSVAGGAGFARPAGAAVSFGVAPSRVELAADPGAAGVQTLTVTNGGLSSVSTLRSVRTRSISPENFDGSPGGGGRATEGTGARAARDLGRGWKVSPSVVVSAGSTFELASIEGPGKIAHLWITIHRDHWRSVVFRAYWDVTVGGADLPSRPCRSCKTGCAVGGSDRQVHPRHLGS